jgi:UDP-N-acetylglucosamine 1-carboxyvinyltransferase
MLPLFIPLALKSPTGSAMFHNWMYESGLFWTSELLKFGANVTILDPHRVMTIAGHQLTGARVVAPYIIRAVVALIIVAMIAKGQSTIMNADSLDRGHENLVLNLQKLGAVIERVG